MKRSGRRSQSWRGVALVVVLVGALAVYALAAGRPAAAGLPRDILFTVTGTCQSALHGTVGWVRSAVARYAALRRVQEENDLLRGELLSLRRQLAELEETRLDNIRLRRLLNLRVPEMRKALMAEVVGRDPSSWFSSITIDRGRRDGIVSGLPVLTSEGVVGQVVSAGPGYSLVRLATDPNSGIGVMDRETRTPGVVSGRGDGRGLRLKYIDRNVEVGLRAEILTSGLDGIFPKGVLVGHVSQTHRDGLHVFQDVLIRPAVDFGQLEVVQILLPESITAATDDGAATAAAEGAM